MTRVGSGTIFLHPSFSSPEDVKFGRLSLPSNGTQACVPSSKELASRALPWSSVGVSPVVSTGGQLMIHLPWLVDGYSQWLCGAAGDAPHLEVLLPTWHRSGKRSGGKRSRWRSATLSIHPQDMTNGNRCSAQVCPGVPNFERSAAARQHTPP